MRTATLSLALMVLAAVAAAFPQLPVGYYGSVRDADGGLLIDAVVKVLDESGVELARDSTNEDGRYSLIVPWDDPDTAEREGVSAGEKIYFFVGTEKVRGTTVGDQGSDIELDLETSDTASSGIPSSSGSSSGGGTLVPGLIGANSTDETEENASSEGNGAGTNNTSPVSLFDEGKADAGTDVGAGSEAEDAGNAEDRRSERAGQAEDQKNKEKEESGLGEEKREMQGNRSNLAAVLVILAAIGVIIFIIIKKRGVK